MDIATMLRRKQKQKRGGFAGRWGRSNEASAAATPSAPDGAGAGGAPAPKKDDAKGDDGRAKKRKKTLRNSNRSNVIAASSAKRQPVVAPSTTASGSPERASNADAARPRSSLSLPTSGEDSSSSGGNATAVVPGVGAKSSANAADTTAASDSEGQAVLNANERKGGSSGGEGNKQQQRQYPLLHDPSAPADGGDGARREQQGRAQQQLLQHQQKPAQQQPAQKQQQPSQPQAPQQQQQQKQKHQHHRKQSSSSFSLGLSAINTTTSNEEEEDDDDKTITRLNDECIKLSMAMSRLRKYTSEWFYLEGKLKAATEELDAAKEDRDLHFSFLGGSVSIGGGGGVDSSADAALLSPLACEGLEVSIGGGGGVDSSADAALLSPLGCEGLEPGSDGDGHAGPMESEEGRSGNIANDAVGGTMDGDGDSEGGVPENVLLRRRDGDPLFVGNGGLGDGTEKAEESLPDTLDSAGASCDGEGVPKQAMAPMALQVDASAPLDHESDANSSCCSGGSRERIRAQYEQLSKLLSKLPKFTPEWFQLKEELVELSIALNDDTDDEVDENGGIDDDTPKEINVVMAASSGPTAAAAESPKRARSDMKSAGGAEMSRKKQREQMREDHEQQQFRPISPLKPPLQKRHHRRTSSGTSSPPPSPSLDIRGSLSPYHISPNDGGCMSPCYSSKSGSAASSSYGAGANIGYCYGFKDDEDDEEGGRRSERISALRAQHDTYARELKTHTQFSKEWFEVKTRMVALSDQIDRLENGNGRQDSSDSLDDSSDCYSSSQLQNQSYMSGWTSVFSESEEEIMSHVDDLECAMVTEALLHRQHQLLYDDDVVGLEEEMFMREEEQEAAAVADDARLLREQVTIEVAVKIQALVRMRLQRELYQRVLVSSKTVQRAWRRLCRLRRTSAAMVQQRWKNYLACKTFVSIRRHALQYQRLRNEQEASLEDVLPGKDRSTEWERYCAVSIQTPWRVYSLRNEIQRLKVANASATVIQTSMRRTHQRRKFARVIRNVVMIQHQWRTYVACRVSVSIRRQALQYQRLRTEQQTRLKDIVVYEDDCTEWERYCAVSIQTLWRVHSLRNEIQRLKVANASATVIQKSLRGVHQRRKYVQQRQAIILIQSFARCKIQRHKYKQKRRCATVAQTFVRARVGSIKYRHTLSCIRSIQRAWRKSLHNAKVHREKEAAAAAEIAKSNPKRKEYDSLFDELDAMLGDTTAIYENNQDNQSYRIQQVWTAYKSCKPVMSLRKRAVRYQALSSQEEAHHQHHKFDLFAVVIIQNHWRQCRDRNQFKSLRSSATKIQAIFRSISAHRLFNQQREGSIIVQSFLRRRWLRSASVYTEINEVTFHSASMGIRLQRGKDGFVRVVSVMEENGTTIVRDGTIRPGDFVLDAAGFNLQSPIGKDQWVDAINHIKCMSRPMRMIVVKNRFIQPILEECLFVSNKLKQLLSSVRVQRSWRRYQARLEEGRAATTIQSCARQKLARCLYHREVERADLLAQCEEMLKQLEMLRAATVIQAYTRRAIVRSSFSRNCASILCIQAFARMKMQRRRYRECLFSVTCIQATVRSWLEQRRSDRISALSPSQKLEEKILALSMELFDLQESTPEFMDCAERLKVMQEELRARRELESGRTANPEQVGHPTKSDERNESEKDCTSSSVKTPHSSHSEECSHKVLEASTPFNDENIHAKPKHAMTVECSSNEHPDPIRPATPAGESTLSSRSGKTSKSGRRRQPTKSKKVEKTPTPEDKLKKLSSEFVSLSQRMDSLPKFSPEWTLSKIELNYVKEELEFLYAESLQKK